MARGRLREAPAAAPADTVGPGAAAAISLTLIALVVLAGIGLNLALQPNRTGAFKNCVPNRKLAPHLYAGPPAMCLDLNRNYNATIVTTKGDISVVFSVGTAPQTVNNFIVLALDGYYNGLPFFDKQSWVEQAGDPQGDGRGGPGYSLPPEVDPNDHWQPGSLGMARMPGGGPISGGQFFITTDNWAGGTPEVAYNHFATITLGFDVAQNLANGDRIVRIEVSRR